ncbi:MAG TPA: MEKHLA domain-containing protein [Sphingobium sp.]|uniref:MEKHLA domain-containing protein n=1 Tax=Sphingobium sp. TaxID=1912891 RepID=UPI002ED2CE42
MNDLPDSYRLPDTAARIALIAESHQRLFDKPLVEGGDVVSALWEAPFAVVAHGTEGDPLFFFGNRVALERFECRPQDFRGMPSRLSAEAPLREERQALLDRVRLDGFITDYAGVRISATGRRFRIEEALVWNLVDEAGTVRGQAACFAKWGAIS